MKTCLWWLFRNLKPVYFCLRKYWVPPFLAWWGSSLPIEILKGEVHSIRGFRYGQEHCVSNFLWWSVSFFFFFQFVILKNIKSEWLEKLRMNINVRDAMVSLNSTDMELVCQISKVPKHLASIPLLHCCRQVTDSRGQAPVWVEITGSMIKGIVAQLSVARWSLLRNSSWNPGFIES